MLPLMEPGKVTPPFTALLTALQAGTQGAATRPAGGQPAGYAPTPSSSTAPVAASAVAFRGSLVRQVRALIEAAGVDQITGSGIAPPGTSDPPPGSPAAGPGHTNNLADGGLNPDQAAMDATGTSKEGARPLAALSAFRNLSAATGQLLVRA